MLDFRIETFLEVCRNMNFTQAARQLNITQPAVSQHIKWLEECYNTRLFVMHGKKLQLTPAGETLRDSLTTMQHDIVSLKEKVQEAEEKKKGKLFCRLMNLNTVVFNLLHPMIMKDFLKKKLKLEI